MPRAKKSKSAPELIRFGVSIPADQLDRFDEWLEAQDFENRSEAIRKLIRDRLAQENWTAGREQQHATVVMALDHRPETQRRFGEARRELGQAVIAQFQTRVNDREQIAVLVLRGSGVLLRQHAERLLGLRGVLYGRLMMAGNSA